MRSARLDKVGPCQEIVMNAVHAYVAPGTPRDLEAGIVEALQARGRLRDADLARAERLQQETGGPLLELLGRLGLVSERDHAEAVASGLGLPLLTTKDLPDLPPENV